ncbi:unnamed protein product [Soboliphyme baturini]|uniref:Phosphatidylserine synthase n=1 Tax=Soboliphyme baturini TaxID=241478 RepID=A0A183J676_9BILA|nr:unnamed protein product [Soboliphyme baturini]
MPSRRTAEHFDSFQRINEKPVEDISLEFFYNPRRLTALLVSILLLLYTAFTRADGDLDQNIWVGLKAVLFSFLVLSTIAFPNGPFTRPHPALWRMIFGVSVFYLLFLQFLLFQNFSTIKDILKWLDPERLNKMQLEEKEYAINCSELNISRIWSHCDIFAAAHFIGWAMKALLIRHTIICWYVSITWELTEIAFSHLLPNFQECWWDAIVLDILLCNGLGIWLGMYICRKLEIREYHWESIRNIPTTRGKIQRAVMQFTPSSWTVLRWLDPQCTLMRILAVWELVVIWQITELNTFFLKHIFAIDTSHPLVTFRICLIGLAVAPAMQQYYSYVTDPKCKRFGTQCWVYLAIMLTEALICVRFGWKIFARTQLLYIGMWLVVLLIGSVFCVYICILWALRPCVSKEVKVNGGVQHCYIDSSFENLTDFSCSGKNDGSQITHRQRSQTICS